MGDGRTQAGRPQPDRELDVKGLSCPMPLLRAKLVLDQLAPGEHLQVEATDPHSVLDFKAYCARTGHELVSTSRSLPSNPRIDANPSPHSSGLSRSERAMGTSQV